MSGFGVSFEKLYNSDIMMRFSEVKYRYPLPETVYKLLAKKLYSPLIYGENSVLVYPPLYGRDHNTNYMWERVTDREEVLGIHSERFSFAHIQLAYPEEKADRIWIAQLEHALAISKGRLATFDEFAGKLKSLVREGREPVFFVNIPETLSNDQFVRFLELAQKTYYVAPSRIHFLLVFDMKWNEADFFTLISPFRSLFQNVTFLPEYGDQDVEHLLKYFCRKWNYPLSLKILKFMVEQAGGILLLVKAALRIAVKNKLRTHAEVERRIPTHPDFLLQLKFFLGILTPLQQRLFSQLARGEEITDERELSHLAQMGLVRPSTTGFRIRSSAVEKYLAGKRQSNEQLQSVISESEMLSKREKQLLIELLKASGGIITRDQAADVLWREKKYDKFSDWALDQTVSRLRKKIARNTDLTHLQLVSHKKKGLSLE